MKMFLETQDRDRLSSSSSLLNILCITPECPTMVNSLNKTKERIEEGINKIAPEPSNILLDSDIKLTKNETFKTIFFKFYCLENNST